MLKIERLVHFTIPAKDLERSEAFYSGLLGFEKTHKNNHMVFLRAGDDRFVQTYSERPVDPNAGDKHEIHHAFLVKGDNYDQALEYLRAKGVRVFKEEERRHGAFLGRSAYSHDPDRNVLEIIDLLDQNAD